MANMLALIGFFENYGIIDIILVDGVWFLSKAIASRARKISMQFSKRGKVLPTENSSFIN